MGYLSSPGTIEPQWVESLCLPASSPNVEDLTRILSEFGKINSISFMPPLMEHGIEEHVFLVNFENSDAAMAAANCLDCILYGFSTVVVRVPSAVPHAVPA